MGRKKCKSKIKSNSMASSSLTTQPQDQLSTTQPACEGGAAEGKSTGTSADSAEEKESVKNLTLFCRYPDSSLRATFPILPGMLTNCFVIEGFHDQYCLTRVSHERDLHHTLEVIDYVFDLKSWVDLYPSWWDVQVRRWDANVYRPSQNTIKIVRSMLRVMYHLFTEKRSHGALHHLENWAMPRLINIDQLKSLIQIEEVEFVLLYENMSPQEGLSQDIDSLRVAIGKILCLEFDKYTPDIQHFFNSLQSWSNFTHLIANQPSCWQRQSRYFLNHPSLWHWTSRRMYIINAMLFWNSLGSNDRTKFKHSIQHIPSAKGWSTKLQPHAPLQSVYGTNGYREDGFDLLRFHRNVFTHILEEMWVQGKKVKIHIRSNGSDDDYKDMEFVEYKLSSVFKDFLTDLYEVIGPIYY